jgi:adenine/guanine phosphoribosyltransferase-like PRPP-binding protein
MPGSVGSIPFYPDSRGSRLDSWTVQTDQYGHVLWLRGPLEVERQVRALAPEYQILPVSVITGSTWTHALRSPQALLRCEVRLLLDVLTEVVSLPSPPAIDIALALDWYKIPQEGVDPYNWPNTGTGELVNRGKYRFRQNPELQAQAGLALVDQMCEVIEKHGVFKQATVILDVPGHDDTRVSFGSRLAATVATRREIPMVRVATRSSFRPEAKNLNATERETLLRDEFVVNERVDGQSVLIVDDVFRSGGSMGGVGRAARQSGAQTVQGLCCVRTMRR